MKKLLSVVLLMGFASMASAGSEGVRGVDFFLGSGDLKVKDNGVEVKPSGLNAGLRTSLSVTGNLFAAVAFEYFNGDDTVSGVKVKTNFNETRAGLGYSMDVGAANKAFLLAEYVKTHLKADASAGSASATDSVGFSGYVVSVGDNLALGPAFNLYARGGYMSVDSDNHVKGSGGDGEVGAQYLVSAPLNLFVEYRYTALKFDSTKLDIGAIRAGMHFNFAS